MGYSVMKRNLCDYDAALKAALAEVARLQTEVADMQCAKGEVAQLQAALNTEAEAQRRMHQENAELAASNEALRLVIQGALEADGDIQSSGFVDALLSERVLLL